MANNKKGIAGMVIGITTGALAAASACLATIKIVQEIKKDNQETTMVSPNDKNFVTVRCGSSHFANGLTLIHVKAENENDNCELSFLAGKSANSISFNWEDDDHFSLYIGDGKTKKCCDVSFEGEEINMEYYLKKD
ncbi:MAG: hypothetical protein ACI3X1_05565 [Eubacteriales bacterium]